MPDKENVILAASPIAGDPSPLRRQLIAVERDSRTSTALAALLGSIVMRLEAPATDREEGEDEQRGFASAWKAVAEERGMCATEVVEREKERIAAGGKAEDWELPAFERRVPRWTPEAIAASVAASALAKIEHVPLAFSVPAGWTVDAANTARALGYELVSAEPEVSPTVAWSAAIKAALDAAARYVAPPVRTETVEHADGTRTDEPVAPDPVPGVLSRDVERAIAAGVVVRAEEHKDALRRLAKLTGEETAGPEDRCDDPWAELDRLRPALASARAALSAFGRSAEEWNATEARLIRERDLARLNSSRAMRRNFHLAAVLADVRAAHRALVERLHATQADRDGWFRHATKQRREKERLLRQRDRSRGLAALRPDVVGELRALVQRYTNGGL